MDDPATPHGKGELPATRWSLVCAARGPDTTPARQALEELCRIYWHPLYCFVRRRGYSPADAEDLVQGFFVELLGSDFFEKANPEKGRMRGFLLSTLRFFLSDERKHADAFKRGGGIEFVPLDLTGAEDRYLCQPSSGESPEQCYDRRWALLFVQRVIHLLADRWKTNGKADLFTALNPFLFSEMEGAETHRLAAKFAMTEGNVRQNLHRLRGEFRAVFREEVADTVASVSDVEEEIAALRAALLEAV